MKAVTCGDKPAANCHSNLFSTDADSQGASNTAVLPKLLCHRYVDCNTLEVIAIFELFGPLGKVTHEKEIFNLRETFT